MTRRKIIAIGVVSLLLQGCIALPTNFQSEGSRRNANKSDLRFLTVGETTRTEVLQQLGEPDSFHTQQKVLLYRASRDVVTAIGYNNSIPMVQKHKYMVLTFNKNGVLILKERKSDVDWVF